MRRGRGDLLELEGIRTKRTFEEKLKIGHLQLFFLSYLVQGSELLKTYENWNQSFPTIFTRQYIIFPFLSIKLYKVPFIKDNYPKVISYNY